MEGTLFFVRLYPLPGSSSSRYALVILNRRGLDNWTLELKSTEGVQITEEYIILQGQRSILDAVDGEVVSGDEEEKIWGIWVFEEAEGSTKGQRAECADWILKCTSWTDRSIGCAENPGGEDKRDTCVGGWMDGVAAGEETRYSGEMHSQHSGRSNGLNGNAIHQQQLPTSPDLMALLNQGRRQQQDYGPPLALHDANAGHDALVDFFRRARGN